MKYAANMEVKNRSRNFYLLGSTESGPTVSGPISEKEEVDDSGRKVESK